MGVLPKDYTNSTKRYSFIYATLRIYLILQKTSYAGEWNIKAG
jgi:hypothetical protein